VLLGCAYVPEELGAVESPDGDTVIVPAVQELNASVSDESTVEEVVISGDQVKRIHTLKASLSLTDEQYRAGLEKITGKRSCKLLTGEEGDKVIAALQKKAQGAPAYWESEGRRLEIRVVVPPPRLPCQSVNRHLPVIDGVHPASG